MDVDILSLADVLLATVPAIELQHTEETYSVFAQVPSDAPMSSGCALGFKDVDGRYRIFEITDYKLREPEGIYEITGVDKAVRELMDEPITEYRARDLTITAYVSRLLQDTRFALGTVSSVSVGTCTAYYQSVWSALSEAQDVFNVIITPYYVLTGGIITARKVDVSGTVGDYRGRIFELGDDLTGITIQYDDSNIKTALYGRGKGIEIEGGDESADPTYGRRLTIADAVWSTSSGDPVDKPKDQEWVGDPDALALYGRGGRHRFGYVVFDDITDPEELLEATWEALQAAKDPVISITASVQDTERLMHRSHEAVRLGDYVMVRLASKKIDIQAKAVSIVRDYIRPEATRLTIGNAAISAKDIVKSINRTMTSYSARAAVWDRANAFDLDGAMDVINNQIKSTTGSWYTDKDTGAIMLVSSDGNMAMRLTGAGWQIASSKSGGEWVWRTAATGSGIVADQITSGKIDAGKVTVGGTGTTLDGTSLTVFHPTLGENVKTVINESGLLFMSGNTVLGGLIRVNGSIASAVQALYNPSVSALNVQVGAGAYGSEDGLEFKLGTVGCFALNAIQNGFRLIADDGSALIYASGGGLTIYANNNVSITSGGSLYLTAQTAGMQNASGTAKLVCNQDGSITLRWLYRGYQREMSLEDLYDLIPKG